MKKSAFEVLNERGFIKQTVFQDELINLLNTKSIAFYAGFDPTADSLHIGHYIPIMAMLHLAKANHQPIALIGGSTALIGDPSGKSDMRTMLTKEEVTLNANAITNQLQQLFNMHTDGAKLISVNNADWLSQLNYIDFLRQIGIYFSVNKMLSADCYRTRLQKGLNFLELNYMLMQSYDFYVLNQKYNCVLQLGGNDQWSNMLFGADLIRRKQQTDAYAITLPLLVNSQGIKMGKTQKGALWLDKSKTTPYEFYQYFRNVEDEKVEECLRLLTFLPLQQIQTLTMFKDERINQAKSVLAYEVTALIHGKDEATKAMQQSQGAFGDGSIMPTTKIQADFNLPIVDVLIATQIAQSKGEARRLIEGGGVKINETKVNHTLSTIADYTNQRQFILHKGKKIHLKIEF